MGACLCACVRPFLIDFDMMVSGFENVSSTYCGDQGNSGGDDDAAKYEDGDLIHW